MHTITRARVTCPPQYSSGNPVCQTEHTYTWDNVAFDGPFTYRDFSYDALDNSTTPDSSGLMDMAKTAPPNQMTTWNVLNMPANPQAASVRVLFNWKTYFGSVPGNIIVKVNGHGHTVPYPYPANDTLIPVTELLSVSAHGAHTRSPFRSLNSWQARMSLRSVPTFKMTTRWYRM